MVGTKQENQNLDHPLLNVVQVRQTERQTDRLNLVSGQVKC